MMSIGAGQLYVQWASSNGRRPALGINLGINGMVNLFCGRQKRPFRNPAVGSNQRLPVERRHVCEGGTTSSPRNTAAGSGTRLSMDFYCIKHQHTHSYARHQKEKHLFRFIIYVV
eukprot:m.481260 g.481260  ORF g.481260 m.481260 type:complete len:115 (-) comp56615_c0_seq1:16-360(-)